MFFSLLLGACLFCWFKRNDINRYNFLSFIIIIWVLISVIITSLKMFQIEINANNKLLIKNNILKSFIEDTGIADKEWLNQN